MSIARFPSPPAAGPRRFADVLDKLVAPDGSPLVGSRWVSLAPFDNGRLSARASRKGTLLGKRQPTRLFRAFEPGAIVRVVSVWRNRYGAEAVVAGRWKVAVTAAQLLDPSLFAFLPA